MISHDLLKVFAFLPGNIGQCFIKERKRFLCYKKKKKKKNSPLKKKKQKLLDCLLQSWLIWWKGVVLVNCLLYCPLNKTAILKLHENETKLYITLVYKMAKVKSQTCWFPWHFLSPSKSTLVHLNYSSGIASHYLIGCGASMVPKQAAPISSRTFMVLGLLKMIPVFVVA